MTASEGEIMVRPMTLEDLDAIFSIDREIRRRKQSITYENLTTERLFAMDSQVGRLAEPASYIDLIRTASEFLALGLVAELEGHVRGFILGKTSHAEEATTDVGVIPILGVHPDYQRRGVATQLVNTLCQKYRSKGIQVARIGVDQRDKPLLNFVEHMGFGVGHLIDYFKPL
jgi:ribosomal protein S18 acetylase RimI-like enzyme